MSYFLHSGSLRICGKTLYEVNKLWFQENHLLVTPVYIANVLIVFVAWMSVEVCKIIFFEGAGMKLKFVFVFKQ